MNLKLGEAAFSAFPFRGGFMYSECASLRLLFGAALISLTGAVSSCGQDPAFTESQMTASSADGTIAGPVDQSSQDGVDTVGSKTGGTSDDGIVSGGTTGDGSSGGSGTGDGGTVNPPPQPYSPPAEYPAGTTQDKVLVEDGGTMVLPGVKALKVGVNFEDLSDFDLNDSVLCFTGGFKVDGRKITSYKKQTIIADVWNNSACGHNITVQIRDAAGNMTQTFKYNDRATTKATMNFDVGSTMFVIMENFANSGCIGPIGMNHPDRAEVAPNLCRR